MTHISPRGARLRTLAALVITALVLASCEDLYGALDNPADPQANSYPGYDTVAGVDDLTVHTADGLTEFFVPELVASKVLSASGYQFQIGSAADFGSGIALDTGEQASNTLAITQAQFDAMALVAGTTYYWRVRAYDSASGDPGPWSAPRTLTMQGVGGLSPGASAASVPPSTRLRWNAVPGAARYELQRAATSGGVSGATAESLTVTSFALTNESFATQYWRVRPVNADGAPGIWSEILPVTVRQYEIGDTGPGGGVVYYDKGSVSDGWRFLESRTQDEGAYAWAVGSVTHAATDPNLGAGYANTYNVLTGSAFPAAAAARAVTHGGYSDWYLPSESEVNWLYNRRAVIGGFPDGPSWWASSTLSMGTARYRKFGNGTWHSTSNRSATLQVRVIRRF